MTEEDWDSGFGRSIAVYLNGQGIAGTDARGERVEDASFLLCFNAHWEPIDFALPAAEYANSWRVVIDTMAPATDSPVIDGPGESVTVGARCLVVLQRVS